MCEVQYIALSDDAARDGMRAAGWPDPSVEYMIKLFSYVRAGYTEALSGDVSKVLGRDPISFDQFASDYAGVFQRREVPAEC